MSAHKEAVAAPSIDPQSVNGSEDLDPVETREWLEALEGIVQHVGRDRAAYLLKQLESRAQELGVSAHAPVYSAYQNTIPVEQQAVHPGDVALEERITALIRWNALAMVVRANQAYGELGGHIASYASAAEIFEIGFNHFFRGAGAEGGGDLVFFQPHSAPGIYARAFLEGRIPEERLANFRREIGGSGLCSYCHPWSMPEFWQFPTGSMGLGPLTAIYHARFMRYLTHRKLKDTRNRHVWGVFGDGEMDEPESVAALTLAAREKLDNLTFIINCNLQRLDGPVRGNGQIIQELEALFTGAGWNVIKVLWGSDWDALFARDRHHALLAHRGQPTVILAKTKKGYGMGRAGESRMTAHQEKKLDTAAVFAFRARFELPLSDEDVAELRFLHPPEDAPEIRYLRARRAELGGFLPARLGAAPPVAVPALETYAAFALAAEGREMSTTMAVVCLLANLLRDKALGPRIVPIVADEARTFGMAGLFKQVGIYSPVGQLYAPEDAGSLLAYRESQEGQILEEGITEAGALSSWIAAATSYSVHGLSMLPFYIYYSMFGFQRVGDLIWAAADQRARGFLLGATAGRTTLSGEGLQHQDGASHVIAATVPNCRAYDPAFAYELAVILDHGMHRMLEQQEDAFYYITVMNENYPQPSLPAGEGDAIKEGIRRGAYRYSETQSADAKASVRLLGSGAILREVIAAAALLANDWCIASEVWSVTSFTELAREAREAERWNRLHPTEARKGSYLSQALSGDTPIIAATDYVCAYPQLIAAYVEAPFSALGTDGFGRSDTRAALRSFFEVDRYHITAAALQELARTNAISSDLVSHAIQRYSLNTESKAPWLR